VFRRRKKSLLLRWTDTACPDKPVLTLSFDTEAYREMWKDALNDHILYANNGVCSGSLSSSIGLLTARRLRL
jgi:hypothetical protein